MAKQKSDSFCAQCGERLEPDARFCTACGTAVSTRPRGRVPSPPGKARRSLPWPLLLLLAGGGLLLLGLLLNQDNGPTVADVPAEQDAAPDEQDTAGLPHPEVPRISAAEARERLDSGAAVIVDVRRAQNYTESHIPGALSLPLSDLQDRYQELPQDGEIITYCT